MKEKIVIITGSIILLLACKDKAAKQTVAINAIDTIPVFILHDTSVTKTIELPAELIPFEQSILYARVQGYVKEIKVDIGDRVQRGQTLAIIEAPELQTKYAEFQSSLMAARAKYIGSLDIYQRMYKASQAKTAGIVAPVELERSRNQLMADSASWEASKKLAQSYKEVTGLLVIEAPFEGIITSRNADRGALVGNNQAILTVQNNHYLRLRVSVPELYIASSTNKKEINFRVDAFPEKQFTAILSRKTGTIDPVNRTEQWEYQFDNKAQELKAGGFAYVKLALQREGNAFIISPNSIVTNQERKFVIRVKNGKAEWVDVRQGMSTDKGIEIFGNLNNGDTILNRASEERKPGTISFWKTSK